MEEEYMKYEALASNPRAMEDYKLVMLALEGSENAFGTLMARYKEQVFSLMYKMVQNREDAEDLTLEAFGKAFAKLKSYTPNFAFSTWLFKIAINNGIDFVRKRRLSLMSIDQNVAAGSKQDIAGTLRTDALDPEEKVIQNQKMKLMQQVMGQLSPKYRLMLEMRFFEELSYQQIAEDLELPLGTVKAQIFRAKELLYELITQQQQKKGNERI